MNLPNLIHELNLTGGFSYNITTGDTNPTSGYMVSLHGYEMIIPLDIFDAKNIKNYVYSNATVLYKENLFLGGWVSKNNVYLDASVNIQNLEEAIYTGIINNQLGIYDVVNKRTISLPSPQTSGTMTQNRTYNRMKAHELANTLTLN